MTKRQMVTEKYLCNWITAEMRKHEGCEDCTVDGVYRLKTPDALVRLPFSRSRATNCSHPQVT